MGNNTRYTPDGMAKARQEIDEFQRSIAAQEGMRLLVSAMALGADNAHLVWRAVRPERVAFRHIARDLRFLPAGVPEPYSPLPPPEHPPRPRPPLGLELQHLDEVLHYAEELGGPINERLAEALSDILRRTHRLHARLLVSSAATLASE